VYFSSVSAYTAFLPLFTPFLKQDHLKRLKMTPKPPFGLDKIEHIGIAVSNMEVAKVTYTSLLGVPPYKEEAVPSQGVTTVFFKVGESKIELLAATQPSSPIAKFIEKSGPGIHHIAYAVEDLEAAMAHLKNQGFRLLSENFLAGADGKKIVFLHPKDTHGTLVELCADI
jgi:methylmalonyl-CoA/ethylmalonyl-CoA epimerase